MLRSFPKIPYLQYPSLLPSNPFIPSQIKGMGLAKDSTAAILFFVYVEPSPFALV